MATLNINGQNVQVDDSFLQLPKDQQNATVDEIASSLKSGAPAPSEGSSVSGVAKSLGSGLAEGVIGLAGMPGDLYHLGLRALGDNLTPESRFGSNAIKRGVEGYTGEFYKPKGVAEETASKIGQFAPAVIGGPETLGAKLLTRAVAPAVASEAAGKLTEGTAAQPYAEVAGALAGAGGATAAANKFKAMAAARNAPSLTVDEIKAASRAGYQNPEVAAVQIKPQAVDNLAATIEGDLATLGFRPNNQKSVFDTVSELKGAPGPVAVADLDSARKALGHLAKEVDSVGAPTANAAAARLAIKKIDDFLPNLNQADLLAGDAAKANQILDTARKNWGAAKRAETVQTTLANAELNAASANSGGNIQNSIKQAFKPLLKNNAAKAVGYNADELKALNNVVRGTWNGSAARAAGNLLGGGGGLGMLASGAVGYEAGGAPGAIAAGLAGRGFKKIGNASTFNAVKRLDSLLRARSPEALQLASQLPPQALQLLPKKSAALLASLSAEPLVAQQRGSIQQQR